MGKGQSVPTDPIFYITFFVLMFMAIAANVRESGDTTGANSGALGAVSIAFEGVFNSTFGSGERSCMFLKDNTGSIDDAYPNGGVMANWQCILIFGMLPFAILYFFMYDILAFTMISERTKNLVALAIAIFALQMKVLVNVTNFLANLTGGVLGGTFSLFGLLIVLGIAGSVIGQFGVTFRNAADATAGLTEVAYGLRTMRAVGRSIERGGQR